MFGSIFLKLFLDFHVLDDKSSFSFGIYILFVEAVVIYILVLIRDSLGLFVFSTGAVIVFEFVFKVDGFVLPLPNTLLHAEEFDACHCI